MIQQVYKILEYSRVFSLPMTVFSWLIIFTFSVYSSGKISYGLLAFLGICLVHLGVNLADDYFDYKYLIKAVDFNKDEYLKHSQKTKCRYLIAGMISERKVLATIAGYFLAGSLIGLFLFLKCGMGVLYFALAGVIFGGLYPFLSRICLSEVAVALTYGPALFGGVYYVMTGSYSPSVFILCIPSMFMTVVLLYIHSVMDFEFDINEGHLTVANRFNSPLDALIVLKILFILAYVSILFLCIFDILDWQVFLTYLTIPLAIDLYKSMKIFACNPSELPEHKWYHFPMENMDKLKEKEEDSFMIRIYQARNLMMYFSLFLIIGIILSLGF